MRVANSMRPMVLALVGLIALPAAAFAQSLQSAAIVPLDSLSRMGSDTQALTYGVAASCIGFGLRRLLRRS